MPVEECLRWLDEHPEVELRSVLPHRGPLLAMLGRFDEAHELHAKGADRVGGARADEIPLRPRMASVRSRDA